MLLEHDRLDSIWIEDKEDIKPKYRIFVEEVAEIQARQQSRTNYEEAASGVRSVGTLLRIDGRRRVISRRTSLINWRP